MSTVDLDARRAAAVLVTEVLEVLLERDADGVATGRDQLVERLLVDGQDLEVALRTLLDDGAVVERDERGVVLSDAGRARAITAVRRHRLAERLLTDVLGIEWAKVHHEAIRFEGVVSEEVESRLIELLGDPGTCPHGNPIPGSTNQPSHPDAVLLADAPVGPVHVVRITESLEEDDSALQLLQDCGFVPGRDAEVQRHDEGWVHVAGTVQDAALPPHVAAHTYVAPR